MDPLLVMNAQIVLGLVGFGLVARWYLGPELRKWEVEDALAVLCLFHAFRYVALAVYAPGQVSSALPGEPVALIVGGDVISAALAIFAAVMLHARTRGAIQAAWIFNIVGLADIAVSAPLAMANQLYREPLGFSWYVFTYYVPALVITHVMMLRWLFRHAARPTARKDDRRRDQQLAA